MGFQVSGINLQLLRHVLTACQASEDPVKDAHLTPANKTVITGFMRTIFFWGITPLKASFQHMNNAADHFQIIDTRDTVRLRKLGLDARKLIGRQVEQVIHQKRILFFNESQHQRLGNPQN